MQIIDIDQPTFLRDLVIKENLFNCNINIVLMKAKSAIDMTKANDYEREDLHMY